MTLATLIGAAATLPGVAAAQSFVPQPQLYMLSTDAEDSRALWVQPASLAKRREASVAATLTANRYASGLGVGQYGLTLASGVLAFGWQHDRLAGGASNDAFVAGLSGGTPIASVGFDHRWYKGTTRDGSWDLGGRYLATRALELSIVWRDISSPVVNGQEINATLVPGAALQLLGGHARVGADWEIITGHWSTSAVRIGATATLPKKFALNIRAELSGHLHTNGLAIGLSWNGMATRASAFASSVRGPDVDRFGLWGAAVTSPVQRRRFGG